MDPKKPEAPKPRFLLRGSPLVHGGKARLLSAKKVKPKRAEPREVSEMESHGYTERIERALLSAGECLDDADWQRYIAPRTSQSAAKRLHEEQKARDRDKRLLSQEERVRRAESDAKAKCRDVSRELWLVRHMLTKGRPPQMVEKRLQVLERVVHLGRRAA